MVKKFTLIFIVVTLAVVFIPYAPVHAGSTYYVATTGNNAWAGTIGSPWRTIDHAVDSVIAGDTIIVRGGTYNEQVTFGVSGTAGNIITLRNYTGETPIIDGTGLAITDDGLIEIEDHAYITIDGFTITNGMQDGTYGGVRGVMVLAWVASSVSDITITNCHIYHLHNCGIEVVDMTAGTTITDITVTYNQIHDVSPVWDEDLEGINLMGVSGFEIAYNTVYDVEQICIDSKTGGNGTIHDNIVTDWDEARNAGMYVNGDNVAVYRNLIYNTGNSGTAFGIAHESGGTLTNIDFYNNIIYGVYNCVGLGDFSDTLVDVVIVNNTFYDFSWAGVHTYNPVTLTSCVVRNNIYYSTTNGAYSNLYEVSAGMTTTHNLYYNSGGSFHIGSEKGTSYVEDNPDFVSTTAPYNFYLQAASPAIDAGNATLAFASDYAGTVRPQNSLYDIGAYEYISGAPYEYEFPVTVTETEGTAHTYYPANLGYGAQALIDAGKLDANGLDSDMKVDGSAVPYMLADDRVYAVLPSLPASQSKVVTLYTGFSPAKSSMDIIMGENGYITTLDSAAIEPGDDFQIDVVGYFDTSAGANKNILIKGLALKLYISAADVVTGDMNNGTTIVTYALTSGVHTLSIRADSTNFYLWIDSTLVDTTALAGDSVPDTADNIIWGQNNCVKYFDSIRWYN